MAKIMKYCNSCDEGFAEKFSFCPSCGGSLQPFEMNPLLQQASPAGVVSDEAATPPTPDFISGEIPAAQFVGDFGDAEPKSADTDVIAAETESPSGFEDEIREPEAEPVSAASAYSAGSSYYHSEPLNADEVNHSSAAEHDYSDYKITVIEEKNVKQRNVLLLGASFLMLSVAVSATIISLFNKTLGVDAIGDGQSIAYLIDPVPMTVEEEKIAKEKDKGGGGGGGGRDEQEETTQGDLADQSKNPTRPPDAKVFRSDDFELKVPVPQTEGTRTFEKQYGRWGNPDSQLANLSNGTGTGGGQGSGSGTGQGSGRGTGTGSGIGSGSGDGDGTGNGDGTGPGGRGVPPPVAAAVTQPLKILFKPKAAYTDEARTNNVQGSVKLKITLLASGQIGSITPVTRLPYGLTEQAIAAARQIRFEPAKTNGVAVSKIVTFDYSFNIY